MNSKKIKVDSIVNIVTEAQDAMYDFIVDHLEIEKHKEHTSDLLNDLDVAIEGVLKKHLTEEEDKPPKKTSRVGQYVIIDPQFTREQSRKFKGMSCRYFGSDLDWHATLKETPAWKDKISALDELKPGLPNGCRIARIVPKKKVPKTYKVRMGITSW